MEWSYFCFSLEVGEKEKNLSVKYNSSIKLLIGDISTQNIKYLGVLILQYTLLLLYLLL